MGTKDGTGTHSRAHRLTAKASMRMALGLSKLTRSRMSGSGVTHTSAATIAPVFVPEMTLSEKGEVDDRAEVELGSGSGSGLGLE